MEEAAATCTCSDADQASAAADKSAARALSSRTAASPARSCGSCLDGGGGLLEPASSWAGWSPLSSARRSGAPAASSRARTSRVWSASASCKCDTASRASAMAAGGTAAWASHGTAAPSSSGSASKIACSRPTLPCAVAAFDDSCATSSPSASCSARSAVRVASEGAALSPRSRGTTVATAAAPALRDGSAAREGSPRPAERCGECSTRDGGAAGSPVTGASDDECASSARWATPSCADEAMLLPRLALRGRATLEPCCGCDCCGCWGFAWVLPTTSAAGGRAGGTRRGGCCCGGPPL